VNPSPLVLRAPPQADIGLLDSLIEDIVEVTETLMQADTLTLEAMANPTLKLVSPERGPKETSKHWEGWGKWGKKRAEQFSLKMRKQMDEGVFKRGVC
jgi:hypothetical protein